jgi:hypothetical protein
MACIVASLSNTLPTPVPIPDLNDLHAISIQQPWLDMILRGEKTWEIRGWELKRRGILALHAPWGIDYPAAHFYGYRTPWKLRRGFIVALATITTVHELDEASWRSNVLRHRQPLPFGGGHFAIELADIMVLRTPVECRGRPATFPVDQAVIQGVIDRIPAQ